MYQLKIENNLSQATVLLNGALTISSAQETKNALLNSLNSSNHLCVDLSAVEEYDLSFMQILISLYRTASSIGKKISFVGNESPRFISFLSGCGCPEYSWIINENSVKTSEEK